MKVFLDANVLVSVLNQEYPLFSLSSRILSLIDHPSYEVYTSPICLAIAFYFSSKKSGDRLAKKKIEVLAKKIHISVVDQSVVQLAASDQRVEDFEDGMQYYSAINEACQVIVTENVQDYYYSQIPVETCEQFIQRVQQSF